MSTPTVRIDADRLIARLTELRGVGASGGGGVTREAFGVDDVRARDLVGGWMTAAGLTVTVDAAANLVGRRPGPVDTWMVSGSHLDTVVDGGWLDGAYGVVAAVEVAAALADVSAELAQGLCVVAFANEEGARGTRGMTGSRALVGQLEAAELAALDDGDVSLGDRIAAAGGDPDDLAAAAWDLSRISALVELHIEQGPVLAASGAVLGVVDAITGRQGVDVEIRGAANHAGTTPMALRHDALAAAADFVLAFEQLPNSEDSVRVATCGHLEVRPNVRNVVPGRVVLSAEYRDEDSDRLDAAMPVIQAIADEIATRRSVELALRWGQRVEPTHADPQIVATIERVVASSGAEWVRLPSGAGHDAQILGHHVPMAMIFVPSIGGVSHSPTEDTDHGQLALGARALLDTILALDSAPATDHGRTE
ncbi:MAG: hypothetical protein JWN39_471 [Ilumatobacteraceae bacterium]|nr:hypothetical protein [Ilumatobacteraceae bacterium]